VNTFRLDGVALGQGAIKVVSADETAEASLEYAYYSSHLEKSLQALGYTLVSHDQESDYIAFLNYSVRESESDERGTSFGRVFSYNGSRNMGIGFGSGIVVVDEGRSKASYERMFQLVIAYSGDDKRRLYEVTGVSRGYCGTLSVVFQEMLEAMLKGFPANNGSLKSYSIAGDTDC
jgi:hypothetical protein